MAGPPTGKAKMNSYSQQRRGIAAACLVTLSMALSGCGGNGLPDGPTGTVSGRVTYQGQPCPADAIVMFVHTTSGIDARGVTDGNGEFQLKMRGGRTVLAGDYEVSIIPPPEDAATSAAVEGGQPLTDKQKEFLSRKWKEIPTRYRLPTTSGEKFTVKPGENEYALDMKDGPGPSPGKSGSASRDSGSAANKSG
jgi:hypothetical protein